MSVRRTAALWLCIALSLSCRGHRQQPLPALASASASVSASAPRSSVSSSIAPPEVPPEPRQGMVWVPPGPLVAGTPEASLPRVADAEMPGEQVILKGYYIDVFPYPNEEGAIPQTNVSQDAASALCTEHDKRLCSELEWERACKGPDNLRYEYGDVYHAERCATGALPVLRPTGIRVACRSGFGTRDMHGGASEWTSSSWGRGTSGGWVSTRGGNSTDGALVGRCANARPERPAQSNATLGFRCCAGTANTAEVVLDIRRGPELKACERIDKQQLTQIIGVLPAEATAALGDHAGISVDHQWIWRPIGNEELYATRLCSGLGQRPACGVVIDRIVLGSPVTLAWASSRHWLPSLELDRDPRDLWMIGGDETGTFQRLIQYRNGTVSVTAEEHRLRDSASPKKKKKKHASAQ